MICNMNPFWGLVHICRRERMLLIKYGLLLTLSSDVHLLARTSHTSKWHGEVFPRYGDEICDSLWWAQTKRCVWSRGGNRTFGSGTKTPQTWQRAHQPACAAWSTWTFLPPPWTHHWYRGRERPLCQSSWSCTQRKLGDPCYIVREGTGLFLAIPWWLCHWLRLAQRHKCRVRISPVLANIMLSALLKQDWDALMLRKQISC